MKIVIALGIVVMSSIAFGHNNSYTCRTTSKGFHFNETSRDAELARSLAIQYCMSSNGTDNELCRANVFCNDGSPTPPMVRCSTSSSGHSFSEVSRSGELALRLAVSYCTSSNGTDNNLCGANASCEDSKSNPFVECTTSSKGYSFGESSRSHELAAQLAVSKCTSSNGTDNELCLANVACNDSYSHPFVTCQTESNGYQFNEASRNAKLASQKAVAYCTSSNGTNNDLCRANVFCSRNRRK